MNPLHATILMVLSARANPMIKPPAPETFTQTVADGEILKVVPRGKLFASESDPRQVLRYYFKIAIRGQEVFLAQVPDEYGKSDFFDLDGSSEGYGKKRNFSLKPGSPVSFSYNVPGGGPAWTLSVTSISK